jgi:BRCA1-associated RING domain protein 1
MSHSGETTISDDSLKLSLDTPLLMLNNSTHRQMMSSPSTVKSSPSTTPGNEITGETVLHVVSIKSNIPSVEYLLQNGNDPKVKDHIGWTPLHEPYGHVRYLKV